MRGLAEVDPRSVVEATGGWVTGVLFEAWRSRDHVGGSGGEADPQELSSRVKKLVDKRALRRARIIGAAIRTAHMLSIGMPGIIDETRLTYEGDKLVLAIPDSYAALDGERLRRRFEALCSLLEVRPELRFGG